MKKGEGARTQDLLKLGEMALSVLLGATQTIAAQTDGAREAIARKLDLVTREEFDAAFAMIQKARIAQEKLERRLESLEKKQGLSRAAKPRAKNQSRAKK